MNIWYFCANPNISLHNNQYAPSLHIRATIDGLQTLGHRVDHFIYADERGRNKEDIPKMALRAGRKSNTLRKLKPLLRDVYELYRNIARDRAFIEPIFRNNSIDLAYERLFPSKSIVSACAQAYTVPIIVESNAPAGERKKYWGSPLQPIFDYLEKRILQRADAVTVVSTPLKRHYENCGISPQKIFVLPNGVDEERFSPGAVTSDVRKALRLEGKVVIGFVGNLHPYHGPELFLPIGRMIGRVREDIHFLLVGGGSGAEELKGAIDQEGLEEIFTLTGPVPNEEVPDYIAAMDICLLPHFMWYGSPMKIFEYGAMGKAIMAPDLENIREVLCHGENAFLFEPKNIPALIQAIQELADDASRQARLGAAARQHILANHTWTRNAERIMEIYHSLQGTHVSI